jgi:O-antigen/teichoic acid export membrane protein
LKATRLVIGLTIARGAVPLGLFVSSVAVGRALHAPGLGRYAALTAIAQIVVWGCGAGFPLMTIRDIAAGRASRGYLGRVLVTFFITTLPVVLAIGVFYAVLSRSVIGFEEAVLAGLAYCLLNAMYIVSAANSGRQAFLASAVGEAVGGAMMAALSVIAVLVGGGIREVLLMACLSWGAATAVLLGLHRPLLSESPIESLLELAKRQIPYLLYGIVNGGYSRFDTAILRAIAGPAPTGVYAAAYRLLGPYVLVGSAFAFVFLGRAAGYGQPWTDPWVNTIRRAQLAFGATMTAAALAGLLIAPWLIILIFGRDFEAGGATARVLLLAVIPYSFYWPLVHGLNTADERRELLWVFAIPTLLNAILVVLLGLAWGPIGAAVAWVTSETVLLLIVEQRFRHLRIVRGATAALSVDRITWQTEHRTEYPV